MNTKRIICPIAALLLICMLLTACGGPSASGGSDSAQPGSVSQQPEISSQASAEPTVEPEPEVSYFPLAETKVLTYWNIFMPMFGNLAQDCGDLAIYKEACQRLNVEIEWSCPAFPVAAENFSIMISSGELCDIIWGFQRFYNQGTIDAAIDDELIADLTQAIADWAPEYSEARVSTDSLARETRTSEGRIAAMCTISSAAGNFPVSGPVIRQDWLDALGLNSPVTYDDYTNVMSAFKSEYGATFGLPSNGLCFNQYFNDSFGIKLPWGTFEPFSIVDDRVICGYATEGYKQYLTQMHAWYDAGIISSDFTGDTDSANSGVVSNDRISTGKVGVFFGRLANLNSYADMTEDANAVYAGASNALLEAGQQTHLRGVIETADTGTSIAASCEDLELAVRFLNWFYTDEGRMLCNYGIEGESYDYDGNGNIYYTDVILNNADFPSDVIREYYTAGSGYVPFYNDNTKKYLYLDEAQIAAGELWLKDTDCGENISKTMSTIMTGDEFTEYSSIYNDIATYFSENNLAFITGDRSLDTFDEFVAMLYDMGLDRVLELVSDAWTRYCA